jgi:hypothetical protein
MKIEKGVARLSASAPLHHSPSLAVFITNIAESDFLVHTAWTLTLRVRRGDGAAGSWVTRPADREFLSEAVPLGAGPFRRRNNSFLPPHANLNI